MKSNKKPTAGIILAAGMSRRLGRPKQLAKLQGRFLLEWVVRAALASKLDAVYLVLGHEQQRVLDAMADRPWRSGVRVVSATDYRQGMSRSVIAGLSAVRADYPSVMFLLGDQPLVTPRCIDRLLKAFRDSDKDICVPIHGHRRGNPTIFGANLYHELLRIRGDEGARGVIEAHGLDVCYVEVDDPSSFIDVDTEQDLEALKPFLQLGRGD